MIQLLIRTFIRDADNTTSRTVRTAYGNLACLVSVVCNLLLFAGKTAVGTLFGSVSITADGLNNLSDASSNIVSLIVPAPRILSILTAMPGTSIWPGWRSR